jgi:ABC-type sugar transport system ATPase subunit
VPVILISHNMQAVLAVADRAIVMRRGHRQGERVISQSTGDELVSLIVGTTRDEMPDAPAADSPETALV